MAETPTLAQLLADSVDKRLAGVHVAVPGNVLAYNPLTQRATIQPGVQNVTYDEDGAPVYEPFEPLTDVPVCWPRVGQAALHGTLAPGDSVELVFQDLGIGEWRKGAPNAQPQDVRKLSFGYPVAIPGLYPDTTPLAAPGAGFTVGYQGAGDVGRVLFDPASVQIGEGVGQALVLRADLELLLAQLKALANVVATTAAAVGSPPVPANVTAANAAKAAIDALAPVYAIVAKGV